MRDERGMWDYLRPKLAGQGMFTRIETRETASGVPDVDAYIKEFGAVKIELKICKRLADGFKLRPAQHRFMQDRIAVGDKNLWILAAIDDATLSQKPRWFLIHGSSSKQLIANKTATGWQRLAWWEHFGYLDDERIAEMMDVIKNV